MNAMASTEAAKQAAPTAAAPQMTKFPARSSSGRSFRTAAGMGKRFMAAFCRYPKENA